jgi:hypothetical protein
MVALKSIIRDDAILESFTTSRIYDGGNFSNSGLWPFLEFTIVAQLPKT